MKPELFSDKDIEELVDKIYYGCLEEDCETCSKRDEVEEGICKVQIAMELWRKWHNKLEERHEA